MANKKKILTAALVVVLIMSIALTFIFSFRNDMERESTNGEPYRARLIQEQEEKGWKTVSSEDAGKYIDGVRDISQQDVKNCFTNTVLNHETLNYFRFMDDLFKDSRDLTDNLDHASRYLYSVLPPSQAQQMLELYKTYLNYQIDIQPKLREWVKTGSPQEQLENLARLRENRRTVFGRENADIIFGASEKTDEYFIRRKMIIIDPDIYGLEKERRLCILNEAMWGNERMSFDQNMSSYARYQEKLNLYRKDLSDVRPAAERKATLEQILREVFTPEQLSQLEEVDRFLDREKKIKEQYYAQEKEILNSNLDNENREHQIRSLQDATFGEEAEAFRRRQAMQNSMEQPPKSD